MWLFPIWTRRHDTLAFLNNSSSLNSHLNWTLSFAIRKWEFCALSSCPPEQKPLWLVVVQKENIRLNDVPERVIRINLDWREWNSLRANTNGQTATTSLRDGRERERAAAASGCATAQGTFIRFKKMYVPTEAVGVAPPPVQWQWVS